MNSARAPGCYTSFLTKNFPRKTIVKNRGPIPSCPESMNYDYGPEGSLFLLRPTPQLVLALYSRLPLASNKKCILAHDPQTHRVSLFGRARTCALEYSGGAYQINCLQCARIDRYANYIGFHGGWSGLKSPHPASTFAAPILKFLVDMAALSLSHARSHLMLRE